MKSYHLKWASHLPNMGEVFNTLYQSEGLADVTLACEDGSIKAHKLILSTCSDYFLELFLECTSKRTVVVLPNIKSAELKDLMTFIYTGEIRADEDTLASLLQVAELLGVRGLHRNKASPEETSSPTTSPIKAEVDPAPAVMDIKTEAAHDQEGLEESLEEEEQHPPSVTPAISIGLALSQTNQILNYSQANPQISEAPISRPIYTAVTQASTAGQDQLYNLPLPPPASVNSPLVNLAAMYQAAHTINQFSPTKQNHHNHGGYNQFGSPTKTSQAFALPNHPTLSLANPSIASLSNPSIGFSNPSLSLPNAASLNLANHPAAVSMAGHLANPNGMAGLSNSSLSLSPAKPISHNPPAPAPPQPSPKQQQQQENSKSQQENKIQQIDLSPADINSIMSQATLPICPLCSKDCANLPNLRSHLQVHNSIKPFSCTFCDSKFARVSHLNRHIRTHTGERPFPCTLCDKSFARQDKLKVHMDRHNKEGGLLPPQAKKAKKSQPLQEPQQQQQQHPLPRGGGGLTAKIEPVTIATSSPGGMPSSDHMASYNPANSLWNGFGMYDTAAGYPHQPVYPGMVNPGAYMPPLQNVMRIGECSVKPVGQ